MLGDTRLIAASVLAPHTTGTVPTTKVDDLESLADQIAMLSAQIQAATYQLMVMLREFDERGGWFGGGWGGGYWGGNGGGGLFGCCHKKQCCNTCCCQPTCCYSCCQTCCQPTCCSSCCESSCGYSAPSCCGDDHGTHGGEAAPMPPEDSGPAPTPVAPAPPAAN